VILILCAFGAEFGPLRARLTGARRLKTESLRGCEGRVGGNSVTLLITGVGVRNARLNSARAMDALSDISLVIITGVAGALLDGLPIGRPVLGDRLMMRSDGDFIAEQTIDAPRDRFEAFAGALDACAIQYAAGPMMTSRHAIASAADKRRAHDASGAIAIDMESAAIAFEAAARNLPFVCMRTILDLAGEDLAAADFADEDGNIRVTAAAKALVTNPAMIAGVARLLRNLRVATHSMADALAAVLPRV
jgi:adenosylhomocysteine nucleosidase